MSAGCLTLPAPNPIVVARNARQFALKIVAHRVSRAERSAVALAAVFLFLLQIVSIGFATGAMAGGAGLLGVVCASTQILPTDSSQPVAPVDHHVDACCILHGDVVVGADVQRAPTAVVAEEKPKRLPAPSYEIDALRDDPEMRPLSPRAPPTRSV
jgi:hypothetical protein